MRKRGGCYYSPMAFRKPKTDNPVDKSTRSRAKTAKPAEPVAEPIAEPVAEPVAITPTEQAIAAPDHDEEW